ncbi:MAG TPA: GntR family transcriptional regulator [Gemmatimonadaceae bacterium]|nr:GntR family transcriptional regulator [Gemmatimonadaceae bacterium]
MTHDPSPVAAAKTTHGTSSRAADRSARGDRIARAYQQLRELIVRGRLSPGARIIESDIAERLGVSRTPVRSALHRLQQEGYIVGIGRGKEPRLAVAPLTQEDARELFGIIGAVEGIAAREAAELPEAMRSELAETLRALNGGLEEAAHAARPDPIHIFDLDTTFHRRYVERGAGPRLIALHDAIKPQAERYVRLYTSAMVDEISRSVAEHDKIIEQIEAGNADSAQRAVHRNWRNAAERLSSVIETLGERGSW